jgi:myosin heavy subunit
MKEKKFGRASTAGGRSSVIMIAYDVASAMANMLSIVKKLYADLFDWIVTQINTTLQSTMSAEEASEGNVLAINILDIFGFEIMERNSFEQLCINFCNERLSDFFNQNIFKYEEEEYKRQGVEVPMFEYSDNTACLELISGKNGIFAMLDEENRIPKGSDESFVHKLQAAFISTKKKPARKSLFGSKKGSSTPSKGDGHPCMERTHPKINNSHICFSVVHFAGVVPYEATGFLEKNKDQVHSDVSALLAKTSETHPFLRELLEASTMPKIDIAAKTKKQPTLSKLFTKQMNDLQSVLAASNPHFVRCIKSNSAKVPNRFEAPMCLTQMRCTVPL